VNRTKLACIQTIIFKAEFNWKMFSGIFHKCHVREAVTFIFGYWIVIVSYVCFDVLTDRLTFDLVFYGWPRASVVCLCATFAVFITYAFPLALKHVFVYSYESYLYLHMRACVCVCVCVCVCLCARLSAMRHIKP